MFDVQKVLQVASSEVGYKGHKTPEQLDDPTANAGMKNGHTYTKFGQYLDNLGWVYNSKKNGYAWCAIFAAYCYFVSYGDRNAQKMLCQHDRCSAAGCGEWLDYFKRQKQYYGRGQGQAADVVFFCDSSGENVVHVGIVESIKGSIMSTIECNASNSVRRKTYGIWDGRIVGYGRPIWDMTPVGPVPDDGKKVEEPEPLQPVVTPATPAAETKPATEPAQTTPAPAKATECTITLPILKEGDKGDQIKTLQVLLQRYKCFSGTVNSKFDKNTASAVRAFQKGKGLTVTSPAVVDEATWKKLLG